MRAGVGGSKPNNFPWEGYGYFLEQHLADSFHQLIQSIFFFFFPVCLILAGNARSFESYYKFRIRRKFNNNIHNNNYNNNLLEDIV